MACCIVRKHPFASDFLGDYDWPYGDEQVYLPMDFLPRRRTVARSQSGCCHKRTRPYGDTRRGRFVPTPDPLGMDTVFPDILRRLFSLEAEVESGESSTDDSDTDSMSTQCPNVCRRTQTAEDEQIIWSQTVELPHGYMSSNVDNIVVKDHKVTIILGKTSKDFGTFHSVTAVRDIEIPDDVISKSIKFFWLANGSIKLCGVRQTQEPRSAVGKKDGEDSEGKDKENQSTEDDTMLVDSASEQSATQTDKVSVSEPTNDSSNEEKYEETEGEGIPTEITVKTDSCQSPKAVDTSSRTSESEETHMKPGAKSVSPLDDQAMKLSNQNEQATTVGIFFEETFNLEPFEPEEIKLKLSGSELFIDAVHRDEDDGNVSSFEMHQSVTIPRGVDLDQLKSRVGGDGKLVISAPYLTDTPQERTLNIELA